MKAERSNKNVLLWYHYAIGNACQQPSKEGNLIMEEHVFNPQRKNKLDLLIAAGKDFALLVVLN